MTTPRLGAPELTAGQATPETTVNEQVRYLESGVGHFVIEDRDLATPPGSPTDGQAYLVAASGTGTWSGHDGDIAYYLNTAWIFIEVQEGFTFWVKDENVFLVATTASTFQEFETTAGENPTESLVIACSDETTALTTGTATVTFRMPYAFTLSAVRASLTGATTTGTITVGINEGGSSILSTDLTIDATEKTSTTAATPAVISDTALADDAEITIDLDDDGDGTATGLKVYLIGVRP